MTLHYFCHLGGLLKLALSSPDDGNHASIRRQCRSGQLHAVSGYVAWPRFGTLRRAIHSVSHACDLQRWSSYRTIAKTIPKRYPSFTKSSPGDRLGTQKAEQVVDVSAKTMPKHYNFEVSSCEWRQSMPKAIFFPKDLLPEETAQAARRRTRQARAKAQVRPNKDEDPSGCASKLCLNRG